MGTDPTKHEEKSPDKQHSGAGNHDLAHKLDVTGWALFFIWLGTAFLLNLSVGIGLLGIGVITLVMQGIRMQQKLKPEVFWVVIGILFVLAGFWELFRPDVPLIPIVLIIAGIALLLSMLRKKHSAKE
jgi:hypothetical protein